MAGIWRSSTGRGRATVVLGGLMLGAGIAWGYPLVAGLGGCLVLLVLAELGAVLGARRVVVRREVQPLVVVRHGHCEGRLHVAGRRRRGLVRLDVADLVDGTLVTVSLHDRLDPDTVGSSVAYPVPTPRRGLIDVGPVQVRLAGLTGMAARSASGGSLDQVRVLPRRIPLGAMAAGHRRAVSGGGDSVELGGTDIVGLHEYAMGEDLRRLHWATSARTGTLMVREDAEPSEPHVWVILDDRVSSYPQATDDLFEEAVELAAALCRIGVDAGNPVRLTTVSGRHDIRVPGSATRAPRREEQDLDWLFAEIDLTSGPARLDVGGRDLDVVVAVTGAHASRHDLGLALGDAPTRVIAVLDPAPLVTASQEAGLLVLRAASSGSLATLWDEASHR